MAFSLSLISRYSYSAVMHLWQSRLEKPIMMCLFLMTACVKFLRVMLKWPTDRIGTTSVWQVNHDKHKQVHIIKQSIFTC
jgi:hypothetical protein